MRDTPWICIHWVSEKKKMDTGADTYWATIAHYQIRFGPAEVGWMRLWLSGKKERSGGGVDRTGRRTACGSGGRDGRAPFPCAACHPQLAAPMRPLDPWRRASITVREREREIWACDAGREKEVWRVGTRCKGKGTRWTLDRCRWVGMVKWDCFLFCLNSQTSGRIIILFHKMPYCRIRIGRILIAGLITLSV
jgi:hypothetical protein